MAVYRLGDLVRECKQKIDRSSNPYEYYIAGEHMESNRLRIVHRGRFADSDVGPAFVRLFKPGQVLYGSRRTYLKKVAVADFEGVTSNVTFVLETRDENVLPQRLLPFVLLSDRFTAYSIGKSKGSTNPYVLFSDLADFEIDLPSIDKLREIESIMCASENLKEHYRSLIEACNDLVKSRFIEMFGDPSDNPFDWPARKLSTIGSLRNGVNFKANDKGFEIRSLGVSDFKDRSEIHDMELISKVEMSNPPRPTQLLQDGDVVFVRSNGNKELVGRCLAVYPGETPLTFSGFCISFRNETPSLALGYLLGFFKAQSTREKMGSSVVSVGEIPA